MRPYHPVSTASILLFILMAALPAAGQSAKPPAAKPSSPAPAPAPASTPAPAAPSSAPVSASPQQTTASYGDWMLRCNHPAAAPSVCEVVQSVTNQERTVAQIVFGEVGHGQPLRLTILVPPSVTLATEAALGTGHEGEAPVVDFTWRRCLSGYCVADAAISEETLQRVRAWTEVARVTFSDAAGHAVVVPFSPRGLPQALDALAKEEG